MKQHLGSNFGAEREHLRTRADSGGAGFEAARGAGPRGGPGRTCWLATTDPDGRPHLAAIGAIWVDGKFYFVSGPRLRKSRNLASNPRCAVSVSLDDIDVVVEGTARKVTDPAVLERVANLYAALGWPASASG